MLQHGLSYLRGESLAGIRDEAFRLIRAGNPDDPLGQYYIGYDNFRRPEDRITGFRSEYAQPGENQVRHFVGGLVIAQAFGGLGKSSVLERESEPYDRRMYEAAFAIHNRCSIEFYDLWVHLLLDMDQIWVEVN